MHWREENRALFMACLDGLESDATVRRMKQLPQHVKGISCYDHSMFVAYVAFSLCRICRLDYRAAARGGMLHDLYLQDWSKTDVGRVRRLFLHPRLAAENARAFGISAKEEDIIRTHMWPLTVVPPRSREGYLVGLADKLCALTEMAHLFGLLEIHENLHSCRAAFQHGALL